jgi:hypothetical protein
MLKRVAIALLAGVAITTLLIPDNVFAAGHGGGVGGFHGGLGGFHGGGSFHSGFGGFHGGGAVHNGLAGFRAGVHGFPGHGYVSPGIASPGIVNPGITSHGLARHDFGLRGDHDLAGFGAGDRYAGGDLVGLYGFNRDAFNRNAFGVGRGWDRWGRRFRMGWDHWGWGWGGWAGPVFWPFLFGDIFSYVLWPYAYDDPFWVYGSDFLMGSIFTTGPYLGRDYGYAVPENYDGWRTDPGELTETQAAANESCTGFAPGVNGLPAEQISSKLHPTANQKSLLDDLVSAFDQASNIVKASCPSDVPFTPVGRLDAARKRLLAIIQAVKAVRPPLAKFDDTLSDEQKQKLAAMAGSEEGQTEHTSFRADGVLLCGRQAEDFARVPVERITRTVEPDAQQQRALQDLTTVSAQAFREIQTSCPPDTAADLVVRFDAVEGRLGAMVDALQIIRPKLEAFYASLSDEQKARFNTLHPPHNASALRQRQDRD